MILDKIAVEEDDMYITGEKVLTNIINDALQKKMVQKLIPQGAVKSEYRNLAIDNKADTTLSVAVRLGKALNVDYVVVGIVWDYKDRIGSKLAASDPAMVSFSTLLVDVKTEKKNMARKIY